MRGALVRPRSTYPEPLIDNDYGHSVSVLNRFGNYHLAVGVPEDDDPMVGFNMGSVYMYFGNWVTP